MILKKFDGNELLTILKCLWYNQMDQTITEYERNDLQKLEAKINIELINKYDEWWKEIERKD